MASHYSFKAAVSGVRYLSMELQKGNWCYLFILFNNAVSVTCYSIIIMDVACAIEATERQFVYFVASKLMFMASYSFIL